MSTMSPLATDPRLSPNGHAASVPSSGSADITGTLMVLSPQMASDLLKNRLPNRPISKARIRALIEDLRSGRWQTNGESIILDAELRLLDGQRRLLACQESGIALTAFVVVGVAPDALPSIDQGRSKVAGDFLSMAGLTQTKELAAAGRWLFRFEHQCMRESTIALRNDALPAYVAARPSLPTALPWGRSLRDLLPQSCASMLYYVMSHKEPGLAKRYFDNLANGDGLSRESAQHIVREKLLRDKTSRNHMGIVRRAALVSMGWISMRSERPLPASVTWKGADDSTVAFPQIM